MKDNTKEKTKVNEGLDKKLKTPVIIKPGQSKPKPKSFMDGTGGLAFKDTPDNLSN